jgi:NAD-specific glutamate dehydrogenase
MKSRIIEVKEKEEFKPFELALKFETKDELYAFCAVLVFDPTKQFLNEHKIDTYGILTELLDASKIQASSEYSKHYDNLSEFIIQHMQDTTEVANSRSKSDASHDTRLPNPYRFHPMDGWDSLKG